MRRSDRWRLIPEPEQAAGNNAESQTNGRLRYGSYYLREQVFQMAHEAKGKPLDAGTYRAIAVRQQYALTYGEVAAALGVSRGTIYRFCRWGRLTKAREKGFVTRRSWDAFCNEFLARGVRIDVEPDTIEVRGCEPNQRRTRRNA